jgi:mono/diheme cytochrome c family protein
VRTAVFALTAVLCALAVVGLATAESIAISETSFKCIRDMHPVRGFYVDSLNGNLDGTLAVANSATGGVYPPGSVVQLVPGEVMVKRESGFNAATHDWEFFELDVSPQGSAIRKRGFTEVVNRFGGNCFGCHAAAKPEWDLVCETTHGCAPIPLTGPMIRGLQKTDPRCKPTELTDEEKQGLAALQAAMAKPASAPAPAPEPSRAKP